MIYTTYRQLQGSILEDDIPWLEGHITGNSLVYGLDTPIDLLVVNNMGYPYMAAELLSYANSATIMSILAQELINAYPYPWKDLYGNAGHNAINDITFRANQVIDTEVRLDYCGDPIPGVAPLDTDSLEALANTIESYFSNWVSNPLTRYTYTWVYRGATTVPRTDSLVGGWEWESVMTQNVDYTINASYINVPIVNIDSALAANPNVFWEQSETIKEQMLAHYGTTYYQRMRRPDGEFNLYLDKRAEAAEYMSKATILAAKISIGASTSLDQILYYIESAVASYESYLYQEAMLMTLRYTEIGNMLMPTPAGPEGSEFYLAEKRLLDTINAKRYDLLHDADYIHSFDTDLSGSLNDIEHTALENGVKAELLTYAGTVVESNFLATPSTNIRPTLQSIMSAYLI